MFDPVFVCDGGLCEKYVYDDDIFCRSHYYIVETEKESFVVTVFHKKRKYRVVEGKSIKGKSTKFEY